MADLGFLGYNPWLVSPVSSVNSAWWIRYPGASPRAGSYFHRAGTPLGFCGQVFPGHTRPIRLSNRHRT
jgi:hypothetical protein